MEAVGPPDSFHLSAAVGWMELGDHSEAAAELDRIAPGLQKHFAVLEVRWLLSAERRDWQAAAGWARGMVEVAPDQPAGWLHLAYATRRLPGGTVPAAWEILRPAAEQFPEHELILFTRACYACQMGRPEEARDWLQRAFRAGGKAGMKAMALRDEDLQPLWPEIEKM
jgi:hypothetical protein